MRGLLLAPQLLHHVFCRRAEAVKQRIDEVFQIKHDRRLTCASQRGFNSGELPQQLQACATCAIGCSVAHFRCALPSLGGRGASGFRPAMVRAHSRACALSVTPRNSRRNSTAADSSPPWSTAARIAAASTSETTNIAAVLGHGPQSASVEWSRRRGRPRAFRNGDCWKLSSVPPRNGETLAHRAAV